MENYEIDNLDRKILGALLDDARKPFSEIASELEVSGGTVHVRMEKLKKAGIVRGAKLNLDYSALGYTIGAFVGINLHHARDYEKVLGKLKKVNGILEAHYTTGEFNIFCKIVTKSIPDLYDFLRDLQGVAEIQTTQTTMILSSPIVRELDL